MQQAEAWAKRVDQESPTAQGPDALLDQRQDGGALLGLAGAPLLVTPLRLVLGGASGKALIPVIQATGMAEIGIAAGLLAGTLVA